MFCRYKNNENCWKSVDCSLQNVDKLESCSSCMKFYRSLLRISIERSDFRQFHLLNKVAKISNSESFMPNYTKL